MCNAVRAALPVDAAELPDLPIEQAIDRLLLAARSSLGADVAFLSQADERTQTFTSLNGDAARFGWHAGQRVPLEGGYCRHVLAAGEPLIVPDSHAHPLTSDLAAARTGGVGSYVGVAVPLSGERVFGTLCVVSDHACPGLDETDASFLSFLAGMIGRELTRAEQERSQQAVIEAVTPWLQPGALQIHGQRMVDLADGTVVGVEALARFPGAEQAGPAEMFAAAGSVGLGDRLELAAITAALAHLPELPESAYLSLNASPDVVAGDEFAALLSDAVCGRVVVELTEHVDYTGHPTLAARIHELRQRGVRLAIDDTGSGYAGLQTVLALQPDIIKLDLALVRGVDSDADRQALIASLADFASHTGATMLAEGIETQAEYDTLQRLGIRCGQGFHIDRPRPMTPAASS